MLYMVNKAIGTSWGPSPKRLLWAYKAMVIPMMSYGSIIWSNRTSTKAIQDGFSRVQRLAMIAMSGAIRSTPTRGLEMILGLKPVELSILTSGYMAWHRALAMKPDPWSGIGNGKKRGHCFLWRDLAAKLKTNGLEIESCSTKLNFEVKPVIACKFRRILINYW